MNTVNIELSTDDVRNTIIVYRKVIGTLANAQEMAVASAVLAKFEASLLTGETDGDERHNDVQPDNE